jgi:hypothetical protein
MIPVKDEPAVAAVTKSVLRNLPGCKVAIVYKGYGKEGLKLGFSDKRLTIIKQNGSGKGVGVVQAAKHIHTEIMCLIDGDATYEVNDLKKVIALVRDGADMALGNRLYKIDPESMPGHIQFGNKVITIIADILYGMNIKDSQTGLRAVRKSAFDTLVLRERYFGIESEMNIKGRKRGFRIAETPIKYYKRVGEVQHQMKLIDGVNLALLNFKWLNDK